MSLRRVSQSLLPHRRTYAIAASPVQYSRRGDQPALAPLAVKSLSRAANGVAVASLDHRGPVSALAVVIGAGTRHEALPGVAHLLKSSLVRARPGDNVVRALREFELRGNTLYTALSRETTLIGSTFLRDDLVDVIPGLVSHVFNPSFHAYEFLDAIPFVTAETEAALADPATRVFDALHTVAFRRGLGNSLFASKASLGVLKRADLQSFASANFTADNIAVVGSGVAHDELEALVNKAFESFAVPATASKTISAPTFFGGEARIAGSGPSHFAIGLKGAAFTNTHAYATHLVLRALLDGTPRLKWGSASSGAGLLASAAAPGTAVSAFNSSYTDAGIFGIYITGDAAAIQQAGKQSIAALKAAAREPASAADLARAQKVAIVDAESALTRDELVADIGKQVLASKQFLSGVELAQAVAKVSADDVAKAAQAALASKAAVVAYGDLAKLPYADEL
ncbi:ubiquinol-cytochrome c reductase core subunit 1 [Entophlyctis luteolus]|nr:ubiquinol-cytochrome c reductase core subunit 1 [Entophlyctis luteolus]KAJ3344940.1 ubiquinol-cytochrome c reductase core subunit 1 [Entophlyctis luteolus]KAJ3382141.1 ubiquinol-cytochrome c reductase core subunit 1 [Entophlyctis sp. JEL0112]